MKYSFQEAAEKESFEAIEYYEERQPGLALKFTVDDHIRIKAVMHLHRKPN